MIGSIVPNSARVLRRGRDNRRSLTKGNGVKPSPGVYMTIELFARKEFNKSIDELIASDKEAVVELAKKLYPGLPTAYIEKLLARD